MSNPTLPETRPSKLLEAALRNASERIAKKVGSNNTEIGSVDPSKYKSDVLKFAGEYIDEHHNEEVKEQAQEMLDQVRERYNSYLKHMKNGKPVEAYPLPSDLDEPFATIEKAHIIAISRAKEKVRLIPTDSIPDSDTIIPNGPSKKSPPSASSSRNPTATLTGEVEEEWVTIGTETKQNPDSRRPIILKGTFDVPKGESAPTFNGDATHTTPDWRFKLHSDIIEGDEKDGKIQRRLYENGQAPSETSPHLKGPVTQKSDFDTAARNAIESLGNKDLGFLSPLKIPGNKGLNIALDPNNTPKRR